MRRYGLKINSISCTVHVAGSKQVKMKENFYQLVLIDNIDEFIFIKKINGKEFYDEGCNFHLAEIKRWLPLFCSLEKGLNKPRANWLDLPRANYYQPTRTKFNNVNNWSVACGIEKMDEDVADDILDAIKCNESLDFAIVVKKKVITETNMFMKK